MEDVSLSFADRAIIDSLGLRIGEQDRIGLIGPNGSGKSTLLRILSGEQQIDSGSVGRARRARVGYLPQDISVEGGRSLIEFVLSSVPGRTDIDEELRAAEADLEAQADGDPDELMALATRVAELHEQLVHFDKFFAEHEALQILAGLGFETADRERDLSEFSGGWKMRAVLGSLLFQQPDLLLMDEPTNHLDMPSVAWLSGFLKRYKRAFVLISHDREFLNEQISRVVSFEPEGIRQYAGDYDNYRRQRAEEEVLLENKVRNLEKERVRMERFVERFRAKATKARQAQSRAKQLAKMEVVEVPQTRRQLRIQFPPTPRTVNEVVRVEKLAKAYGEHVVFDDVNLIVQRGEKIGIIGPNGAGKTTLLKIIGGELEQTGGTVNIGSNVTVGYYAQHHAETLHGESTVYDEVARANPDATPTRVRSVLGAFLFSGDDVDKQIRVLSGGERARVALARLLINPGSLLLMDEPSNHLDLESTEALAESLADFDGTIVFVSHNRSLIRTLAGKIWNIEDGQVETYPGTLDEYMWSQQQRLAGEGASAPPVAAKPKPAPEPEPAVVKGTREDEKARKRREAEARQRRSKVIAPIQKRIDKLEGRISELESAQRERSTQLSDPDTYENASLRNKLLDEYQKAQDKLDELTGRWEAAVEELDAAENELAE